MFSWSINGNIETIASLWTASMSKMLTLPIVNLKLIMRVPLGESILLNFVCKAKLLIFSFVLLVKLLFFISAIEIQGISEDQYLFSLLGGVFPILKKAISLNLTHFHVSGISKGK